MRSPATFVRLILLALAPAMAAALLLSAPAALATCIQVAGAPNLLHHAAYAPGALAAVPRGKVRLTFVGHASFEIETPKGVRAVTDYNGYVLPPLVPHIVTMNNSHPTHFTTNIPSEIKYALLGWNSERLQYYNVELDDLRVRSIPTNIYPITSGSTQESESGLAHGNSIFVFEAEGLCLAHISHVHHRLSPDHIRELGRIDVAMVAIDGAVTMSHIELLDAINRIGPRLIVPMHMFSRVSVESFARVMRDAGYTVREHDSDTILLNHAALPPAPEVLFLQGR